LDIPNDDAFEYTDGDYDWRNSRESGKKVVDEDKME